MNRNKVTLIAALVFGVAGIILYLADRNGTETIHKEL